MPQDNRRLTVEFPSCPVWVNGHFMVLYEDGSVEFYCDGDVRISLADLKEIALLADHFMWLRENRTK